MPHLLFPVSDFRQLTETMEMDNERCLECGKLLHLSSLFFYFQPTLVGLRHLIELVHSRLTYRVEGWDILCLDATL